MTTIPAEKLDKLVSRWETVQGTLASGADQVERDLGQAGLARRNGFSQSPLDAGHLGRQEIGRETGRRHRGFWSTAHGMAREEVDIN